MERQEFIQSLPEKLQIVHLEKEKNILIADYVYEQSIVSRFFLDFENDNIEYDLQDYLEEHISSHYYKTPGYLQWNYYLIFIREEGKIPSERKVIIEKDDVYARKFIFNIEEFLEYFEYKRSNKTVETDIVSLWKEKLRAVDLDEVYSNESYAQAIPRFIASNVIKENITEQNSPIVGTSAQFISKISRIDLLDEYRLYPKIKTFELGRVNLLHGVNGSGKTSFLEAVELIVAGKSNKDPDFDEKNNCIAAIYNDDDTFKDVYTPNDNAKYRIRDTAWYSSSYKTGNELYRAFNRYNYFDSDAAYKLAYDSDLGSISRYLSAIALGSEFNRIQDRLQGFNERLLKELRDRERIISEEEANERKATQIVDSIQSSASPQTAFLLYSSIIKEISWKGKVPQTIEDDTSSFEKDINSAEGFINSFNQFLLTLKLRSPKALSDELKKIKDLIKTCEDIKSEIVVLTNSISGKQISYAKLRETQEILKKAKAYFSDPRSFELQDLDLSLDTLQAQISKFNRVIDEISKLTNIKLLQSSEIFGDYKVTKAQESRDLIRRKATLNEEIVQLRFSLSQLENIVSEIKSLGHQFLLSDATASSCPLCHSDYANEELARRISSIDDGIKENTALASLNQQLAVLNRQEQDLLLTNNSIAAVEESISVILDYDEYSILKFVEISERIEKVRSQLELDIAEALSLRKLKEDLGEKGLTEANFNDLKAQFGILVPSISFEPGSRANFEDFFQKLESSEQDAASALEADLSHKKLLEEKIANLLIDSAPTVNTLNFDQELAYRRDSIQKALENSTGLQEFLLIKEEDDFADIQLKVEKLHLSFNNYRKVLLDQTQLNVAKQTIETARQRIEEIKPVKFKLEQALIIIKEILENDSETKILGAFIKNNEQEIQDIFQSLHSPKEFSQIKFDFNSHSILLQRNGNEDVSLVKISTGQRSALALSIFLALNKKLKSGPNIILFDDPVTYIDDLNILSFLDYLRELVIEEGKQLFFATANQKLVGLFSKKFKFLNSEFKEFPLER